MKILITGGIGYIGSHTCVELLNEGYEIVIIDNLSNSCIEVFDRIKEITNKSPLFYQVDLLDEEALEGVFYEHDFDAVIHFAGLKSVGESISKPLEYYLNNVVGTLNLLKLLDKYNVNKMVFSSSATVYGLSNEIPFKENAPLHAINPYGNSKIIIEQMLRDYCTSNKSFTAIVLRYFNPIGAHESGLIGEEPQGVPNNLLPYIAQVAAGKLTSLGVYGDDYDTIDGTGVRDYIHVVDLAQGHIAALEYSKRLSGIDYINLGTGRGYSVLEVIKTFEEVSERKIPYTIEERRAGDIASCYADVNYAKDILKWQASKDLKEMCLDLWRYTKLNHLK